VLDVPEAERLVFRRMRLTDLDDMAALLGDPTVMVWYPRPKTRDEAADWIRWNLANYERDGFGLWVLHDRAGEFVGDCGLTWQRVDGEERLEVGYHVRAARQGEGLATEAALACLALARARGVEDVVAIIRPENAPSRRVAEKIGLVEERRTTAPHGMAVVVYATPDTSSHNS
jgi:RimJ/RimL family protein N-acetyltransferase